MLIYENESLKKHTTIKIGGQAKKLYFPESIKELIDLLNEKPKRELYIIGGGSNLLINDKIVFDEIICIKKMDQRIKRLGKGTYYIGASVSLQELINTINSEGFGGIEYLYSVPALVGGAIVMNAGRGKVYKECISDFILDVYTYDYKLKEQKRISKDDCDFSYRNSIFKNKQIVVLGATFQFKRISKYESGRRKQERLQLIKKSQDSSGPNFGSVFRESNKYIMELVKLFHPGYANGMTYSKKTRNWLINQGEGTYDEAITLINRVIKWHKLFGMNANPEVIMWE